MSGEWCQDLGSDEWSKVSWRTDCRLDHSPGSTRYSPTAANAGQQNSQLHGCGPTSKENPNRLLAGPRCEFAVRGLASTHSGRRPAKWSAQDSDANNGTIFQPLRQA